MFRGKFDVFHEKALDEFLADNTKKLVARVEQEPEASILRANETGLAGQIGEAFKIGALTIDFDHPSVSSSEREFQVDRQSERFAVFGSRTERRQVITYHLPISGNVELLRYAPANRLLWSYEVHIEDHDLCFEVVVEGNDVAQIKQQADGVMSKIREQAGYMTKAIEQYNADVPSRVAGSIAARKDRIVKQRDTLSSLGLPIKKPGDVSGS